jgi:hypothetical protein
MRPIFLNQQCMSNRHVIDNGWQPVKTSSQSRYYTATQVPRCYAATGDIVGKRQRSFLIGELLSVELPTHAFLSEPCMSRLLFSSGFGILIDLREDRCESMPPR